jgi:pyruvate dehydrogenase E1 component alpha subunit
MHLFDRRVNMWGSSAILGGSVPIGAGLALAMKRTGSDGISVAFAGDGGIDEGAFYETLNLAALLRLPILFAVENNGYSTLTRQEARQANPDIIGRAQAFGVEALTLDGNDALGVYAATSAVIARMRADSRPALLELMTYRLCAHVGPAPDLGPGQRPAEEFHAAQEREPLARLRMEIGADRSHLAAALTEIEVRVESEVHRAFESAKARFAEQSVARNLAPPPPPPRYSGV